MKGVWAVQRNQPYSLPINHLVKFVWVTESVKMKLRARTSKPDSFPDRVEFRGSVFGRTIWFLERFRSNRRTRAPQL